MYDDNKTLGARVAVHRELNNMLKKRLGRVPEKWIYNYAHAVVDQKGYKRATPQQDFKYILLLIGVSVISFFRWQQRVPVSAIRTMGKWAGASFRNLAQEYSK